MVTLCRRRHCSLSERAASAVDGNQGMCLLVRIIAHDDLRNPRLVPKAHKCAQAHARERHTYDRQYVMGPVRRNIMVGQAVGRGNITCQDDAFPRE